MKTRSNAPLFFVVGAAVCLLVVLLVSRWTQALTKVQGGDASERHAAAKPGAGMYVDSNRMIHPPADRESLDSASEHDGRNANIKLNGVVIDHEGKPLAGVDVVAIASGLKWKWKTRWLGSGLVVEQTHNTNTLVTDPAGRFTVAGMQGIGLHLGFDEQEYVVAPGTVRVWLFDLQRPDRYVPEEGRIEVFRLWRRRGGSHLLTVRRSGAVAGNGEVLSWELPPDMIGTGRQQAAGIEVRIWRQPEVLSAEQGELLAVRYEMRWFGAEVQLSRDVFPYVAPETGYENQVSQAFRRGEDGFPQEINETMYFLTDGGKYGYAEVKIMAGDHGRDIYVYVTSHWNPNGSRNLEPMP